MKKTMTLNDFMKRYSPKEACLDYLIKHKWNDGYVCRCCGNTSNVKGRKWHYRRCAMCFCDESATAHTLFHKLKFPSQKAFGMVYALTTLRKGMSSCELARQFGVHQEIAWFLRRKVQRAMKYNVPDLLKDNVEFDETLIGGFQAGKPGRSKGKNALVQVAVEVDYSNSKKTKGMMKRVSARILPDGPRGAIKEAVERTIDHQAVITTDGWPGYIKALEDHWHNIEDSSKRENFELHHWYIFNLKNWLRRTHNHASKDHLQDYLDGFNFRFCRRNYAKNSVFKTLRNMIKSPTAKDSCLVTN